MLKLNTSGTKTYLRLVSELKRYWWVFALGIMATACGSGIDSALAWLVKPLINKGFINKNDAFIQALPVAIIVIFSVRGAFSFISNYCISRVGRLLVTRFRQKVFNKLLTLPASYYDKHASGALLSTIIYNVEQIAQACTTALLTLTREGFFAIGLIGAMILLSWKLTLLFAVVGPIIAWVFSAMSKRMRKLSTHVQESVADVTHIASETIDGYKVVRTFGGQQYESDRFYKATETNRNRELKIVVTDSIGNLAVQCALGIPVASILYLVTSDLFAISAGAFAAFFVAMLSLRRPIRRLTRINGWIQKGIAAAESIFELLDKKDELDTGTRLLKRARGMIEYQHVSLTYPGAEKPVLDDINFTVNPGETVALVGHSGAGKSSVINVLMRFYDPTKGQVRIDKQNSWDYKLVDLRRQFALVSQHITLFNTTIKENIAYGQTPIDEDAVIEAAKKANAYEFIQQLPQGFETPVGENGVLLSGGQRQRIAIARALLKDAPILILDEATSALDSESERIIQDALETLMKDRTTIVIAHRLSTIEKADNIIVLNRGRIVESGTHDALIEQKGHYQALNALQSAPKNTDMPTQTHPVTQGAV